MQEAFKTFCDQKKSSLLGNEHPVHVYMCTYARENNRESKSYIDKYRKLDEPNDRLRSGAVHQ